MNMYSAAVANNDGGVYKTIYFDDSQFAKYQIGGSRSWRDNNPGNLRHGNNDIGVDRVGDNEGFRIFPDYETGFNELKRQIEKTYLNYTIEQFVKTWAPAADHNNVEAYISALVNSTGKTRYTKIKDCNETQFLLGIQKHEGFIEGTVQYHKHGTVS
jgi:hypothetical protein